VRRVVTIETGTGVFTAEMPQQNAPYRILGLAALAQLVDMGTAVTNGAQVALLVGPELAGVILPVMGSTSPILPRDEAATVSYIVAAGVALPSVATTAVAADGPGFLATLCVPEECIVTPDLKAQVILHNSESGDVFYRVAFLIEDLE